MRGRLTVTSLLAASIGLVAGALGLSWGAERVMLDRLDAEVAADARAIAAAPDDAAVTSALARVPPDRLAQVRSAGGAILAATPHSIRQSADLDRIEVVVGPAEGDGWVTGGSELASLDSGWRTATVRSDRDGGVQVTVAAPTADLHAAVTTVTSFWTFGIPLLLAMTGLLVWAALGRTFRSIEVARRQVAKAVTVYPPPRLDPPGGGSEIAALVATFDDLLARTAVGVRAQRRFLANAAHELLSPLSVIRTNIEVARRRAPSPDVDRALRRCLENQARLETLAQQLLALARTEDADPPKDLELDLLSLLEDLVEDVAPSAVGLQVTAPERAPMSGDPVGLRMLLDNLLRNACRYATTLVHVTLLVERDTVVLHVDDDGPGIPPSARHTVLQPFVRLDAGRDRSSGGAGLGLAIAMAVADHHGGRLEVADGPGGGARLTVVLPRRGLALTD